MREMMKNEGVDNYLKQLNIFCMDVEEKAETLDFCIKKKDLNLYIAIVQAFKNTAMSIGAFNIAEFAMKLENAYESEAIMFIAENTEKFVSDLTALQKDIIPMLYDGPSETPSVHTGDIEHLNFSLIKIKNALRSMAIGEAKKTLNELKSLTWEREKQDIIIKISRCILLFEYDEAIELIDDFIF
jgi:HPt (histidine-containing phosphotransfer) domain-containing protein